ncbi:MAG: alpha/beta fold hydrolase [Candidatus Eiseniibacteriota bacterium]
MYRPVRNESVEILYRVEGQGEPLVLLHGFTDNSEAWRDYGFVQPLMAAGRRLVMIDARGHGRSGRPHDPAAYAPRARAADVIAVLDALRLPRADVLGYSMGGWTAYCVAQFFPERVRSVIAGGTQPYGQSLEPYRRILACGLDSWADIVEEMADRPVPRRRLLANDIAALKAVVAEDRPNIAASVARSRVPMMLYAGSADPIHDLMRRFAREADAEFLSLAERNHIQALLAAEVVVPHVVTFLERLDRADAEARAARRLAS